MATKDKPKDHRQENPASFEHDEFPQAIDEAAADAESVEATPPDPQAEIDSLKDALLRAKADFANLQRRAAAERTESVRFANADLLRSLLGVLDDFDRTVAAADTSDNLKSVVEGVHLVHANLTKALSDNGLEEINALHQTFDPNIHEALLQQPTDEHPPGTVVEQVAKGYKLRDRVLRPARVIVAKTTDDGSSTGANASGDSAENNAS